MTAGNSTGTSWRLRTAAAAGFLLAYAATGLYTVGTNERALVRRFGRILPRLRDSGLHLSLPYGLDRIERVRPFERQRVSVGSSLTDRLLGRGGDPRETECLTADRNLLVVSAVVQYHISDPVAYVARAADVAALVRSLTAAALSRAVSRMNVDDILTVERLALRKRVKADVQERVERLGLGVSIAWLSLEGIAPPPSVAEAFRDVASARGDRERTINEAKGYANRLLPQARGEAHRIVTAAEAEAEEVVELARGAAARFERLAAEAVRDRRLAMQRLLLETAETVLPRLQKVVLDTERRDGVDIHIMEEGR